MRRIRGSERIIFNCVTLSSLGFNPSFPEPCGQLRVWTDYQSIFSDLRNSDTHNWLLFSAKSCLNLCLREPLHRKQFPGHLFQGALNVSELVELRVQTRRWMSGVFFVFFLAVLHALPLTSHISRGSNSFLILSGQEALPPSSIC